MEDSTEEVNQKTYALSKMAENVVTHLVSLNKRIFRKENHCLGINVIQNIFCAMEKCSYNTPGKKFSTLPHPTPQIFTASLKAIS